jgi:hypothetical protein
MQLNKEVPVIHIPPKSNKTLDFAQTDSEENFLILKEKLGKDWYYYDKDIEYKYNSWGYRSKEFSELNDDYILVLGCSFTEGIGLHYDDMWSTKLANELNMDVFNLSIGGSGPDIVFYNTILFHNFVLKNGKLPKYVVYQWTFENRTSYMFYHESNLINLETFSISYPKEVYPKNYKKYFDWYNEGFVANEGELIKQSNVSTLTCHNLWKTVGVPVYHWTWGDDFNLKKSELFHNTVEVEQIQDCFEVKGRDGSHNGHLSQDIVVDKILEKIKNGFS